MTMQKFKRLFNAYKKAEKAATVAEMAYDQEPENETIEAAFDRAYEAEHKALMALADGIVEYTTGMVDRKTARIMIMKMPERLEAIVNKIA